MVSIIGPSGSGKSTLLNLIGGLDQPTSGEIHIDGRSIARLSDDALTHLRRDNIGFIFQFFNLMPSLTCLENVALPLHLRGGGKRKIQERVAIAPSLAAFPPILLADEPTGNLDSRSGADILDLIRSLHEKLNATILIVTHEARRTGRCGGRSRSRLIRSIQHTAAIPPLLIRRYGTPLACGRCYTFGAT
jgi:putative ABC transport system ATP-binding protein